MRAKYQEIRNRYSDVVCSVDEGQLFEDVQALIAYVDVLRVVLARQAQVHAAEEALRVFENDYARGMRVPC